MDLFLFCGCSLASLYEVTSVCGGSPTSWIQSSVMQQQNPFIPFTKRKKRKKNIKFKMQRSLIQITCASVIFITYQSYKMLKKRRSDQTTKNVQACYCCKNEKAAMRGM